MLNLIIHSDGGARGNPGPAAVGVVIEESIENQESRTTKEISEYIGEATNNQAEYQAVIEALKWISKNGMPKGKEDINAEFLLDSELVVKQLNGEYKIKNEGLKPLFWEIRDLITTIGGTISFSHIRREQNIEADKLVNEALDRQLKGK